MLKKDKTKPFRLIPPAGPTAEDMLKAREVSELKADRTPIPDNRFTLPPEYGVAGGGSAKIIDGHEYVDLGLPSGILWAKMNVGAESETDPGLYFQWADTQGYTEGQVGIGENQKAFSWADYKYCNGTHKTLTKYCWVAKTDYWAGEGDPDNKSVLDPEDDSAHVIMGGEWYIPKKDHWNELFSNCTVEQVSDYGDSLRGGYLFTSKRNGNTLFIPLGGVCNSESFSYDNEGILWASTRSGVNPSCADYANLMHNCVYAGSTYGYRSKGMSIRAINITNEKTSEDVPVIPT